VKMGRYGAENGSSKVTEHFSLLLDGKLTCSLHHSGYVIFLLRDRITKLKTCQIYKYNVFTKIAKFDAFQISHYTVARSHNGRLVGDNSNP